MNNLDKMILLFFLAAMLLLPVWGTAAEPWGSAMVKEKKFDFGRVAIGSDTVHRFTITNVYEQDVRLVDIRSSCGCTIPSLTKKVLKSMEAGEIVAQFNTSGQITRDKSATLTVDLETVVNGKVLRDAVQVHVSGYIRPDVVLTPGIVEFGSVPEGKPVVRTVMLDYAGRNDWALTKVERNNTFVHARAEEVKRQHGEVSYKITVTLKPNAPVGYVRDALRFITNEVAPGASEPSEIALPIQGFVMSPIHAKPSPFMVGIVSVGENVSKTIVVRSDSPFKILDVSTNDKRFRFTYADQESPIQIVAVLFSAKRGEPGPVDEKIVIRTNLRDQEFVSLDAHGMLVPKENVTASPPESSPAVWRDNAPVLESPSVSADRPPSGFRPQLSMRLVDEEPKQDSWRESIEPLSTNASIRFESTAGETSFSSQTPTTEPTRPNGGIKFGRPKSTGDAATVAFETVAEPPKKVAFRVPSLPERSKADSDETVVR